VLRRAAWLDCVTVAAYLPLGRLARGHFGFAPLVAAGPAYARPSRPSAAGGGWGGAATKKASRLSTPLLLGQALGLGRGDVADSGLRAGRY
jgi:hypothetical protein